MTNKTVMTLALFAVSGCAAIQLPQERLAGNEASMRGAEELGASGVPTARLHLQLAREQTLSATKLAASGDDRALMMLARAQSDAELSLGMAREVSVHADAQRAAEDLKAVRARSSP
jgi:hypothetical protein